MKYFGWLLVFGIFLPSLSKAQFIPDWRKLSGSSKVTLDYSSPKEYTIAEISVSGAEFLDRNSLISLSGLRVGEKIKIPSEDLSNAIRKLWKQGILGDVKINILDVKDDKVYLQLELKERPRLSRFVFEGLPKGQKETISDKIKLIRGRVVTDAMLKNTKNTIVEHYAEKGFSNIDVDIVQQKDTILNNSVVLVIKIDKKKKVKIDEIIFEGLSAFEEKKVKRKLKKTKEHRFGRIFSPSKYVKKEYIADKEKLISFYNTQGYRNAAIVKDSVYTSGENRVSIKLVIEEGHKFYYRNIYWKGNYKYESEVLDRILGIEKGNVYNPDELGKRLNYNPSGTDITSLYMDDGYLFFSIDPVEVMVDEDSIDIEMRISEGAQADINKIMLNGNTKTNDHVVFRELRTLPGEKFSRADLIRTQRELSTLGYFDPEKVSINPLPNMSNSTVDIAYGVEERPNDQIELSGGWGGQFGFVGTMGIVFNNFSSRNFFNKKAWKPLPSGDGQRLSLRLQANGRTFQTYSASFTEPWLGGRQANSFTVSLSHSVQRQYFTRSRTPDGTLKLYNVNVSLGRRLKAPDDFFTMVNSIGYLLYDLNNFNSSGFNGYNNGQSHSFTFNTTISRNNLDNPIYPRAGASLTLSGTFTPPYSRIFNTDFTDASAQERFKLVEYHKYMFDNSWFLKLAGNLVLNARAHFGFLLSYNNKKGLAPFERFILGGSGLTQNFLLGTDIVGLRGYQDGKIVPYELRGQGGVVYNKYVLEMRYPVSLNPSATIFLTTYLEGGNNWATMPEFNPFKVYRSAGIGARIFMPAFGMIGIDYANGIDEVPGYPGANGPQFHFTIGQQIR